MMIAHMPKEENKPPTLNPKKKPLPNLQENQSLISINLDEEDCEHAHAIGGCDHTQNPMLRDPKPYTHEKHNFVQNC
jgi:hypothetical protein